MKLLFTILCILFIEGIISCSNVKPYEREHLSDPIMESAESLGKQSIEAKFFSTQEGAAGGESGIAGGCGCAQ